MAVNTVRGSLSLVRHACFSRVSQIIQQRHANHGESRKSRSLAESAPMVGAGYRGIQLLQHGVEPGASAARQCFARAILASHNLRLIQCNGAPDCDTSDLELRLTTSAALGGRCKPRGRGARVENLGRLEERQALACERSRRDRSVFGCHGRRLLCGDHCCGSRRIILIRLLRLGDVVSEEPEMIRQH
jgi:hypothetical protein